MCMSVPHLLLRAHFRRSESVDVTVPRSEKKKQQEVLSRFFCLSSLYFAPLSTKTADMIATNKLNFERPCNERPKDSALEAPTPNCVSV